MLQRPRPRARRRLGGVDGASRRRALLAACLATAVGASTGGSDSTEEEDAETWDSILFTAKLAAVMFISFIVLFECLRRRFWWVYAGRTGHFLYQRDTPPQPSGVPLSWTVPDVGLHDDDVFLQKYGTGEFPPSSSTPAVAAASRHSPAVHAQTVTTAHRRHRLDATVFFQFVRFCIKSTGFASIVGCFCLVPIYATAPDNTAQGLTLNSFQAMTMTKVLQNKSRLWAPVVASYVLTFYTLFHLNRFYVRFCVLRTKFMISRASGVAVVNKEPYVAMQEALTAKVRG